MTYSMLVYLVASAVVCVATTESAAVSGGSPTLLDLSKGKYTRDELKRSELLKHGDASQWEEIDLSGNHIDEIDDNIFLGFENLKRLSLASNSLGTIEENWFRGTKLSSLDVSNNTLVAVRRDAFADLEELRELNLANNLMRPFKADTFKNNIKLLKLNLENNPRAHWMFKNVTIPSLEELNLKKCRITSLTMVNFENMPSLKKVDLEGNIIHELHEDSLRTNSKLKDINLRDNALIELRGSQLKKVFSPNANVVVHMDYDEDRCVDCELTPCTDDAELQRYLCENPQNKTSVYRGVYEWKNEPENTVVTFMAH